MNKLTKFRRLPLSDKVLLVKAIALVALVRAGLTLISYRQLSRLLRPRLRVGLAEPGSVRRVLWSIQVASRIVPRATCLTTSLAAQLLLARSGHPADVHIGVRTNDAGKFIAHAWVSAQGKIVHGQTGHDLSLYRQILCLKSAEQ